MNEIEKAENFWRDNRDSEIILQKQLDSLSVRKQNAVVSFFAKIVGL